MRIGTAYDNRCFSTPSHPCPCQEGAAWEIHAEHTRQSGIVPIAASSAMRREKKMSRTLRILILLVSVLVALVPATAFAQGNNNEDGELLLRVNGPVVVGAQESHENVVVISDDATVDGTIDGSLFVIDGDAVINGRVEDDVTVISGKLTLGPTAQVHNVSVIRGNLVRDAGSTVTGDITENDMTINAWDFAVFSAIFWVGMTAVVFVSGLLFAAVGARQLKAAGDRIVHDVGPTLLASALTWIVMPIVMVLAFVTIVGIPMGIGYFLFVLPVAMFLGYLVAGTQLGRMILKSRGDAEHPYLASLLGLAILQIIGWIPWLGGIIGALAGVVGSGALVLMAWQAWRGPRMAAPASEVPMHAPSPAA